MASKKKGGEIIPDGLPVHVVAKVFPAVVPLGQARKPDDLVIESSKSITVADGSDETYDLDYVYDSGATVQDLYSRTLVPALNAFLDGVNGCIVLFGSAASQRVQLFQGDATTPGIIPKIIDSVFVGLHRKGKALAERAQGTLDYSVSFTFCEIYDEVVQDLLNSQNRDLTLSEDLIEGMKVDHLTVSGPHSSAGAMMDAFQAGVRARSTVSSEFGPPSHYASAIFKINLYQEVRAARGKSTILRDSLTLVDIAGAEKVGGDETGIKAAEGPRLNKGAFGFKGVCQAMAAGKHADFIPHSDSKLTLALKEAFGGNCFTRAVFTLSQADVVNRSCLNLAVKLREGVVFPVVMDIVAQGLMRRLRLENKTLRQQLAEARTGNVTDERKVKDSDTDLMLRISELEGQTIKHNLEKLKLQEDRDKLYERFREFRDKYNQLVGSKAELQTSLIEAEESKLQVSKALLDLQIENNQLKEIVDQEKFDLGAKLMTAENDVVEMEMKYQAEKERALELQHQVETLVEEKKEIAIELVSLRTNLIARTAALKNEKAKTEDLAEHVLTLANTKEVLEKQLQEAGSEKESAVGRDGVLKKEIENLRQKNEALEVALKELAEEHDEVQAARIRAELQAEKLEVEYNKKKLAVERSMQEYTSNVDTEMAREKERGMNEMEQLQAYRTATDAKIKQLESSVRPLQRKIAELKLQLSDRDRTEASLRAEVRSLEERTVELANEHRNKLLNTLAGATDGESPEETRERVIQELTQSHRVAEQDAQQALRELRDKNHGLVQQNRVLGAAVRELQQQITDLAPTEEARIDADKQVQQAMAATEASSLEKKLGGEVDQLRRQAEELRQELSSEKERHVANAEKFRRSLMDAQQQAEDLQVKLQRAEEHVARLEKVAEGGGEKGGGLSPEAMEQLKSMQEQLTQAMEKLAEQTAARPSPRAPSPPKSPPTQRRSQADEEKTSRDHEEIQHLREETRALRKENKHLRSQVSELEEQLRHAQDELSAAKAENVPRARRASVVVKSAVPAGPVEEGTLMAQLQESEQRAVALLSRNTVLEEELDNYKKYLKAQVKKYQKEISKLKKELAKYKKKG